MLLILKFSNQNLVEVRDFLVSLNNQLISLLTKYLDVMVFNNGRLLLVNIVGRP